MGASLVAGDRAVLALVGGVHDVHHLVVAQAVELGEIAVPVGVDVAGAEDPRLLLLPEDETRIRRALITDVTARSFRDALLRNGSRLLTQPTPERVLSEQPWVFGEELTVQQAIEAALGKGAKIEGFARFQIGK